jgi:hypothetical protein
MFVRIGHTFLNLAHVVAVQVRNRERDGACIAVVETTADGGTDPSGAGCGPHTLFFEGDDARTLEGVLDGMAVNGNDGGEPLRAA